MVPVNDKRNDLDYTGLVLSRPSTPFFRRIQNKMVIGDAIDSVKFFLWMGRNGTFDTLKSACQDMNAGPYNTYCYFIGNSDMGFVKIGISKDPMRRIEQIRTDNPFPLALLCVVPGDEIVEKKLHRAFAPLRMGGEWFRINTALRTFMVIAGDEFIARQNWRAYSIEQEKTSQAIGRWFTALLVAALAGWTSAAIGVYTLVLYLMGAFS